MKIGLYFGSFNPVHNGHLIVAEQMASVAGLEQVWFVLSPQNPLKANSGLLDEGQRLHLLQKAIAGNSKFVASDIEFHLSKPSYTIHTLKHLQSLHPDADFSVIMGSDNLNTLDQWKDYRSILEHFPILVYARGVIVNPFPEYTNVIMMDLPYINISATQIRKLIADGKSIRYLVPEIIREEVEAFYK